MSFLKNVYNTITNNRELKEPQIHKAFQETSTMVSGLTSLAESGDPGIDMKKVNQHLKLFSIGQAGEKNVLFELQNSMLPMMILHDVYIKHKQYEAQLDFVILTHKFILVLEVKKLFGNIHVTDKGEFQRVITNKNRVVNKEGIYSPINQVERHVAILEKLLKEEQVIKRFPVKYAVTFANPKTLLNISKKAPEHIQKSVIRHDQIKTFIKQELEQESASFLLDHDLYNIADAIMTFSQEKPFNSEPYQKEPSSPTQLSATNNPSGKKQAPVGHDKHLKTALTDFRARQSAALNTKPALILSDDVLHQLVEKKPVTIEELTAIQGIDFQQVEQFGTDIISIIQSALNAHPAPPAEKNDSRVGKQDQPPNRPSSLNTTNDQQIKDARSALMTFRTTRAKELNAKPYYIFTNKTLDAILLKKPATMEELLAIEGIGPKKAEEFGQEILTILRDTGKP